MNQELIDKVKEVQRTTDINFSPYYDELPRLINQYGFKSGINIGVFAGGQEKRILDTTQIELLVGVDPYLEYKPDQIGMGTISSQEEFDIMCELAVNRLDANRFVLIRKTSDEAYPYIASTILGDNLQVDILFVDGLHEASQLQRDLDNYVPLVRKGGVIAIHDVNHPTFPELTDVIYNFAREHSSEVILGPLHFCHIEKTW